MERSDSISSTTSRSSGTFAYHARALERAGSLSRASSVSSKPNPILNSAPNTSLRRWTPTHRIGHSVDAVRTKTGIWEERARQNQAEASLSNSPPKPSRSLPDQPLLTRRSVDFTPADPVPPPPPPKHDSPPPKRHTISTPISLSSYLPSTTPTNQTGDSTASQPIFGTPPSRRFPLPSNHSLSNSPVTPVRQPGAYAQSSGLVERQSSPTRSTQATETVTPTLTGSSTVSGTSSSNETAPSVTSTIGGSTPTYRSRYMQRKAAAKYGEALTEGYRLGKHLPRIASGDGNEDWEAERRAEEKKTRLPDLPQEEPQEEPPRPMTPIRSHDKELPRPSYELPSAPMTPVRTVDDDVSRRQQREVRLESLLQTPPPAPRTPTRDAQFSALSTTEDIVPGRLRLARTTSAPSSPLPSTRITGYGLWADVQRHLIQAYEYLCHVGEAQQWIEGCLGEELGFGVVEMEERLRNGVVLARLAQVWDRQAVRKIFDDPRLKLGWRHTDNINHFLNFVQKVGLPDCFIFIVTDLYDKKNIPKVIYCIHALSHLLARRGMAQKIGNLVGRLKFSDDQLQQTQKGLKASGVPMPNFGDISRELAKEINEEAELEEETEDEKRDRMLLEVEDSIIKLQAACRGYLSRLALRTKRAKLRLAERYIAKAQARSKGYLIRQKLAREREKQINLTPFVIALQATIRGALARRAWNARMARIRSVRRSLVKVQAQARGVLARRRYHLLKAGLRKSTKAILKLQSLARAKIAKTQHVQLSKTLHQIDITAGVISFQAHCRGVLARRKDATILHNLQRAEPFVVGLQGQARAALTRRRLRTQLAKLDDAVDIVVQIQAAARAYMARKRLLNLIRGLRKATTGVVGLQATARALLVQKRRKELTKTLGQAQVIKSIGSFQSMARAALARREVREQLKQLDMSEPDIVGFQSAARGALVRNEYWAWRDHLHRSQLEAIYLQSLCRGILQRRKFKQKVKHYRENLDKVVKIQSLFRANQQREQYKQLTLGKNVSVSTIKNFVHLLDDSEADFQEEIEMEELRKKVVEAIRENQHLETEVDELDSKIGQVVQNMKSFDEVIKARRRHGADSAAAHAARAAVLAAHGDPFAGPNTLDAATKKKLELYQQLFYLLQTKPEYLARLFYLLSRMDVPEKRLAERVSLTLYGYGQDRREDYLLLKLFQMAIHEEVRTASSIDDVINGHPMYLNVAFHYVRPKQVTFVKDALATIIKDVVGRDELDLETDPSMVHRNRIQQEEMRTGVTSSQSKEVRFDVALADPDTRVVFIRHLQILVTLTRDFVQSITTSTRKLPYSLRFIARETLLALRAKFPNESEETYAMVVGRLIYYRYINPAIIGPETFDIVPSTLGAQARKNLGEISRMLTQIASGQLFGDEAPWMRAAEQTFTAAIHQMGDWFLEVADVPDAETHYQAHEFLDVTVQPKPIYISPNEVYAMHSLLLQHLNILAPSKDDPLRIILRDLDGVPNLRQDDSTYELHDARDKAITLELTNRFAVVADPLAEEKALWVRAKRGVLAILRVQPGKDLVESLMSPITEDHELLWEEIIDNEMTSQRMRHKSRRMASTTQADASYRLEDIRSQSFQDVKAHAIFYLLELEKAGKITRNDGYQGILDAIASDVHSKHRKRLQRQHERASMQEALKHLKERKRYFEEQIKSYHDFAQSAMTTMQKGRGPKKRFVIPFSKQYYHIKNLQKTGQAPQFGSFKYSAQDLYDKGILLSIDQFSPRQFDRVDIVFSSNTIGEFKIEVFNSPGGGGSETLVASTVIKMEELLQAQYENKISLTLFDGMAKMHLNSLLYQINKKFYV